MNLSLVCFLGFLICFLEHRSFAKEETSSLIFKTGTPLETQELGSMSEAQAFAAAKNRLTAVQDLLKPQIDPYKGEDSTPSFCIEKNLPAMKQVNSKTEFSFRLAFYSSPDRVLGLCSANEPSKLLKTQYLIIYCKKNQKLSVVRSFYPGTSPWLESNVAQCHSD